MQVNSKGSVQFLGLDDTDSGEGLAIFFSQDGRATCRYRVLVKAKIDQGIYDVGEFFVSPPVVTAAPAGRLSRMVASAVCPGAIGWDLEISAVKPPGGGSIEEEVADVILASSKCCTSPVGVSRVGERYGYIGGNSPGITSNYSVLAGQRITRLTAVGLGGGGQVSVNGGNNIPVLAGTTLVLEPKAPVPANSVIAFNNVEYSLEFLESA